MDEGDDIEAERTADRVAVRFRQQVSRLPLRSTFVDALANEARPAVHALLFALSTDRAGDVTSLEHHETTAMVALLGRAFALDGSTPTAAAGVVPALLDAFRTEGFAVPAGLDAPLSVVFLEGYVRGREERLAHDLGRRGLEHVVLVEVLPRVGLVVVRGSHDPESLATHLESLARDAFARDLAACVVDASFVEGSECTDAVLHFAALLGSVGTAMLFVGPLADAWAVKLRAESRPDVQHAVERACEHARLVVRDDRSFVIPFRGLFRGRAARR